MMSANEEVLHAKCENWKYSIAILFFCVAPTDGSERRGANGVRDRYSAGTRFADPRLIQIGAPLGDESWAKKFFASTGLGVMSGTVTVCSPSPIAKVTVWDVAT